MAVKQSSLSDVSKPRSGAEIREAFLKFFAARGHKVLPSSSLVPEDPTVLLTIAGMLQFKPVFLGQQKPSSARVTTSQKCIRTNDIENVGKTARHQTFFEMLGNFSFGNYFKQEAIEWAWELITNVFGLDPQNLVISVFREDKEAEEIWREIVGVNPKRIIRMDEGDNFWSSGITGPCGPCSEIYYDFKPNLGDDNINLEDDERFIEFYNLVFMEYSKDAEGKLTPLAHKNIDTGMGLERMAQILQKKVNNYETDLIYPIILKASSLAGLEYLKLNESKKTSLKIIGDHSRAITFLLADGVSPSNLGRGYVTRRLIRRVIRHGKLIGIDKPFLIKMAEETIKLMRSSYPQLIDRRKAILAELEREEKKFLETLGRGEKLLSELLSNNPDKVSGDEAFELYDTFGFPLELTQEIAKEQGVCVDIDGFNNAMEKQRHRAKAAATNIDLTVQDSLDTLIQDLTSTEFKGYDNLKSKSTVIGLIVNAEIADKAHAGDNVQIMLNSTSFYGEGGGQIGDHGSISSEDSKKTGELLIKIQSVYRKKNIFIHTGKVITGQISIGEEVVNEVDQSSRRCAQVNHTATHLLQAALKIVIEKDISQAGSLVDFKHLRFDFNLPRPISADEKNSVEDLVNKWITESYSLEVKKMPLKEAKEAGAIAMFGEKYEDEVRVVNIPGVSMELCGGTHVSNTAELGLFKIINESGISSGIRRIEAVAGPSVLSVLTERDNIVKKLTSTLKAQPKEIVERVLALSNDLKETNKLLEFTRGELANEKAANLAKGAKVHKDSQIVIKRLDGLSGGEIQLIAQNLISNIGENAAIILGGLPTPNDHQKVILVAAFGKDLISKGLKAGQFINEVAKICGGGGGGRPNLAQAGGKDGSALNKALEVALEMLKKEII